MARAPTDVAPAVAFRFIFLCAIVELEDDIYDKSDMPNVSDDFLMEIIREMDN